MAPACRLSHLPEPACSMVHEIVGRINGQYGTLTHVPIYHLDRWDTAPPLPASPATACARNAALGPFLCLLTTYPRPWAHLLT